MTLFEFLQSLTPFKAWSIGAGIGIVLMVIYLKQWLSKPKPADQADVIDINDPTYDLDHQYHWKDYTDL